MERTGSSNADAGADVAADGSRPVALGRRVRVYLSEGDRTDHAATYVYLLEFLQREGAAGSTVFRGLAGFGAPGRIHTATLADIVEPLPVVLEWVDTPERVGRLLPALCALAPDALITVEEVQVAQPPRPVLRDVPRAIRVREVMTPAADVQSASPDTPLHDLAVLLLRRRLRAVPVVDASRRVVGIITNTDLVERGGLPLRLELLGALGDPEHPEVAEHLTGLHGEGRTAASIMTQPVVTVGPDLALTDAARLMLERRLKRLPVVDPDGRLLGILSRLDVLKTAAAGYPTERTAAFPQAPDVASPLPTARAAPGRGTRPISSVMQRNVPTVHPDTPLPDVLAAVVSTRLNRAVVVDHTRRPVGLIVDVDLLQRITPAAHPGVIQTLMRRVLPGSAAQQEQWHRLTGHVARDLMRPRSEMLIVPEDADIADVIDEALERRIKLVAVVDQDGRLVGMADRADLLGVLAQAP